MVTPAPRLTLKDMLRQVSFRRLWLAQFVSVFGDFLALFGVISLITFRLHGSAVQVTAVSIAYALPLALFSPFAGVLVDHWNVKRVMIASDLIRSLLILALVFLMHQMLNAGGAASNAVYIRWTYVVFGGIGLVSSFFSPAQSATVQTVVPREDLLAANVLMSQAFYTVRLIAPTTAGWLISWLSEKSCFYLDSLSFFYSATIIATLGIVRPPRQNTKKTVRSLTNDFVAGNKFIFNHGALAFVFMAMVAAMFVLSSISPLISIYIRDALQAGPRLFGVISSMVGLGMILGTQLVNRFAPNRAKTIVVLGGLLGLGVGAAFLGIFRNTPMSAVSTFTMGFAIAFVLVPAQTLSQQETPREMMGRVSSSFLSMIAMAQVLGLVVSGYLAQLLGIRQLFVASALCLALLAGGGWLLLRKPGAIAAASS
jgi:DHA3 family macrolide efflux protein-like MFS transporter